MIKIFRLTSVLLLLLTGPVTAAEFIQSFHSEIEIRRNGDLQVTETIRVRAEGKSIRRGIYRDFPTRYRDARGRELVVGFDVTGVKRDGVYEPFHIKDRGNGKRVYLGDANVYLSPGFYEYELSYVTTRQLGFFDDFDELYWNVIGTGWEFRIDSASVRVILPDTVSDLNLTGYTGVQGSTAQALTYRRAGPDQAFFETTAALAPREGLTIVVAWPKGIVDAPTAAQRRLWQLRDHSAGIIMSGGAIALLVFYLMLWRRFGKDPAKGIIIPRYRPPTGYSPASMRFVERMGYDNKCFTAAVINLAAKGLITISEADGNFDISRQNQNQQTDLAAGEQQVLRDLFGKLRQNLSVVQDNHSTLSGALSRHKRSLERDYEHKYFNNNYGWNVAGVFLSLAIVAAAGFSLQSSELIAKTVFVTMFALIPLLIIYLMTRAVLRRGRKGISRYGIFIPLSLVALGFFYYSFPLWHLIESVPVPILGGFCAMLLLNFLFYEWMKAPTLAGRRLLDQVDGFRHYLSVAEEDEIKLVDAPKFSSDIYEAYLPYAIALDLENEWTQRLSRAVAQGLVDRSYRQPEWYDRNTYSGRHFSSSLSSALDSAIASSSVAPGSSSGSSGGGFSGGGGGGGGGGGW